MTSPAMSTPHGRQKTDARIELASAPSRTSPLLGSSKFSPPDQTCSGDDYRFNIGDAADPPNGGCLMHNHVAAHIGDQGLTWGLRSPLVTVRR